MRYNPYAMIVALVVTCGATSAMAEGSGSWLWPFGGQRRAEDAPAVTPAPPELANADGSRTSPSPTANWPKLELPHVPHPSLPSLWPSKDQAGQVRNAWAKPTTQQPEQPSPWQVVTDGAHRVGTSVSHAWHKTVDVLNPFAGKETSVAQHQSQPSFWSRMFGGEEQKPQGPRTVTEWMAQQRLDP
jgi:hypothetical protein